MSEIRFFSPTVSPRAVDVRNNRHLDTLEYQRVGFLWGMHDLSIHFWPVMEEEVISAFSPLEVYRHHKTLEPDGVFKGNTWIAIPQDQIEEIAPKVDYVVCGVGACGSCTNAAVRDAVAMLKQGIPAVVLVHSQFGRLARALLGQLGVEEDASLYVLDYPEDRPEADTQAELHERALQHVLPRLPKMITSQPSERVLAVS